MIQERFEIPIFDFQLHIIQLEENDTLNDVEEKLDDFGIKGTERPFINPSMVDGGHTLSNGEARMIVVFFHQFTSEEEKIETYGHEIRHIVDRICIFLDIQDLETCALLSGYIEKLIYLEFDRRYVK